MRFWRQRGQGFLAGLFVAGLAMPARAQVSVWTYHNDNQRTGVNAQETALTPANVNPFTFGKLFEQPVDGQVYAQPLYVPNVTVPGKGVHNIVFVATQHDSVYAFDADSAAGENAAPLWHRSFIDPPNVTTVPPGDVASWHGGDISPEIGITGTPVIDVASGTLYVVPKTKEVSGDTVRYVQRLHALDIATGAEKPDSPVEITATVPGTGYNGQYNKWDAVNGQVAFNPMRQHQRSALALVNGNVYIAWASHEDVNAYHGWIIGYDAKTLAPAGAFNDTPNGAQGGIWMAGGAPAADADGHLYAITGNGTFDPTNANFGDSFLKLNTTGGLSLLDYFTPFNQAALDAIDFDLGSSGPVVLPDQPGAHPHLLVGCGKEGKIYLLDRDAMGGFNAAGDTQIVQSIPHGVAIPFDTPTYWNGRLYFQGPGDVMRVFALQDGKLSDAPVDRSGIAFSFTGATPSITSNGTEDGIVWTLQSEGFMTDSPAILHAYDAMNVSHELYNSAMAGDRDALGLAIKFTVPTVANGKVYAGMNDRLDVLGPIPDTTPPAPGQAVATSPTSVTVSFNRPLDPMAATDPASYGIPGATVSAAALSPDGRVVTLTTSPLTAGAVQSLTVHPLSDRATPAHAMAADATLVFGYVPLAGDGLLGTYFKGTGLAGPAALQRVDPEINLHWGPEAPDPAVGADEYSVRWTGYVMPSTTGTYTFTARMDDGVRLWVGGTLLIDAWWDNWPFEYSATADLVAGRKVPIRIEHYKPAGFGGVAELTWSGPGVPKQIIPRGQLYSGVFAPADLLRALALAGGLDAAGLTDVPRLDILAHGAVDLPDAVTLARKLMGLDANP